MFSLPKTVNYKLLYCIAAALAVVVAFTNNNLAPLLVAAVAGACVFYAEKMANKEETEPPSEEKPANGADGADGAGADKAAFKTLYPEKYGISDYADDVMSRVTRTSLGGEPLHVRDRLTALLYKDEIIGRGDPYMEKIKE